MGSSNSKGLSAAIAVVVDRPNEVIPGQPVTGKVYLSVIQPTHASSLVVRVYGGEYSHVRWTTTSGGKHKTTHHHSTSQSTVFLDMSFPLFSAPDAMFMPGPYEYPFSFVMPKGVHPSMSDTVGGDHGGNCSVSYTVEARLDNPGWTQWDYKTAQPITVLTTPPDVIEKIVGFIEPQQVDVYFFCCFYRGDIRLGMKAETTLIGVGQEFWIDYVVANDSSSQVKAVTVSINQSSNWSANGHSTGEDRNLLHQRMEIGDPRLQLDLKPLEKAPDHVHEQQAPLVTNDGSNNAISSTSSSWLNDMKYALDSGKSRLKASIPLDARATMHGGLINVTHTLSLTVITTFGTDNVYVSLPLTIYRDDAAHNAVSLPIAHVTGEPSYPPLPADWHGQAVVAEAVTIPALSKLAVPTSSDSHDAPPPSSYENASAPSLSNVGFSDLLAALTVTYDKKGAVDTWLQGNDASSITPSQLYALMQAIADVIDQVVIAEKVGRAMGSLTCEHVAQAAFGSHPNVRTEVVTRLACDNKVSDKANKAAVKAVLSDFQFACVEQYFQQ